MAIAQLVVHFMADPVAGLREMARVTRPGGRVAANVWDYAGGSGPLTEFWERRARPRPGASGRGPARRGTREATWRQLMREGRAARGHRRPGRRDRRLASYDEWWDPYTLGVGPAGSYVAALDPAGRDRLRARCESLLPDPPFEVEAVAWFAVGVV